jgi:hypothetical protein
MAALVIRRVFLTPARPSEQKPKEVDMSRRHFRISRANGSYDSQRK